jgi:hypothetical protein
LKKICEFFKVSTRIAAKAKKHAISSGALAPVTLQSRNYMKALPASVTDLIGDYYLNDYVSRINAWYKRQDSWTPEAFIS